MKTEQEYLNEEYTLSLEKLTEIEGQPLPDRQAARDDYKQALGCPEVITHRMDLLLNGDYGKGSHILAAKILAGSVRTNKIAGLSQLLAAYEYLCPANFARQAYLSLTPEKQKSVNQAIQDLINEREAM